MEQNRTRNETMSRHHNETRLHAGTGAGAARHTGAVMRGVRRDGGRLDAELIRRFASLSPAAIPTASLSRVEQAMRRNAPDLAGAPLRDRHSNDTRRKAQHAARWPRPRLAALVVLALIALLQPLEMMRLAVSAVALFLVVSVVIGPETARDGVGFVLRRMARFWRVELRLAGRLAGDLRRRLETWSRTAL